MSDLSSSGDISCKLGVEIEVRHGLKVLAAWHDGSWLCLGWSVGLLWRLMTAQTSWGMCTCIGR